MNTASFHLMWIQDKCRAVLRGHVDEPRLNALFGLVAPHQTLCLDMNEAHLSPEALAALRKLAVVHPLLKIEPASFLELVRAAGGRSAPEMDLMAILAHEMRSPLSLVHTRLQTLGQTLASEGREPEVEACRRSIHDLATAMRLFEFYLTAAQPWHLGPVALAEVAAQGLHALEDIPDAASVSCTLDAQTPAVVYGHPRALHQLVHNLVLNAAQACGAGGEVRVGIRETRSNVVLVVADNGPGFPPEILRQPFVPYRTDRRHGTGLGLVICKWIVDRHRGTLSVANRDPGATVSVALPVAVGVARDVG